MYNPPWMKNIHSWQTSSSEVSVKCNYSETHPRNFSKWIPPVAQPVPSMKLRLLQSTGVPILQARMKLVDKLRLKWSSRFGITANCSSPRQSWWYSTPVGATFHVNQQWNPGCLLLVDERPSSKKSWLSPPVFASSRSTHEELREWSTDTSIHEDPKMVQET